MKKINFSLKFKFNKLKKVQRWAYLSVILLALIIIFQLGLFLYTNVFLAIRQIDRITIIQSKVAEQTIDMAKFKQVMKTINNKNKGCELDQIKDPFYPQNKTVFFNRQPTNAAEQATSTLAGSASAPASGNIASSSKALPAAGKNKSAEQTAPKQNSKTAPENLDLSNIHPKH